MTQELKSRWTYAGIVSSVVLLCIFVLGQEAVFLLSLGAGLVGWREYARFTKLQQKTALNYLGYAWILFSFTSAFFLGAKSLFWLWFSALSCFSVIFGEDLVHKARGEKTTLNPEDIWRYLTQFVFGTLYIFMIFGFVGPIMSKSFGVEYLILSLIAVTLSDTCAYFGGKRYGKNKLWPEISPGKTREGVIAGALGSMIATLVIWALFYAFKKQTVSIAVPLILGLLATPLGVMGDLLESLMKRVTGVKDSGTLLAGHGGLLDRVDALVFVLPLVYFLF